MTQNVIASERKLQDVADGWRFSNPFNHLPIHSGIITEHVRR